jgi:hypothetical protein
LQLDRTICDQFTVFYPQVMALLSHDFNTLTPRSLATESDYSYPNKARLKELEARQLPFLRIGDIV